MKIAFIGGGEVGQCYAKALSNLGHSIYLIVDSHPTEELKKFSLQIGAELSLQPSERLDDADVIVCAVFGAATIAVATQVAPFVKKETLYIDLTTGKPADILAASEVLNAKQVQFVDVAIAGAISISKEKTPLLIAGKGAPYFVPLAEQLGAPVKIVGQEPGAAVSLKLLRSVFTKGCEALAVECLVAAEKKGLRAELYDVLSDMDQTPISVFLEMCVNTHIMHARRRMIEVQEAMEQMTDLGIDPVVTQGVERLFKKTTIGLDETPYAQGKIEDNLAWLTKNIQASKH